MSPAMSFLIIFILVMIPLVCVHLWATRKQREQEARDAWEGRINDARGRKKNREY